MNKKLIYLVILVLLLISFPKSLVAQDYSIDYAQFIPRNFLFVVDCSKRMNRKIRLSDEKKRIDIIKQWLPDYINNLPYYIPVGMRIYGHEDGMITFSKCDNSDVISYVGTEKRHKIDLNLYKVKPSKEIPLGVTLNKAINYDFNDVGGLKEIILITDNSGNCKSKPCQIVNKLLKNKNDVKINVVGMGVKRKSVEKTLKCLTASTFGKYYNVINEKELKEALDKIIFEDQKDKNTFIK